MARAPTASAIIDETADYTPSVAAAPVAKTIPQTPLSMRADMVDDITVRFNRWHAHGNTAYQKGQFAGFSPDVARRLIALGVAVFAEDRAMRQAAIAARGMITK